MKIRRFLADVLSLAVAFGTSAALSAEAVLSPVISGSAFEDSEEIDIDGSEFAVYKDRAELMWCPKEFDGVYVILDTAGAIEWTAQMLSFCWSMAIPVTR